MMSTVEFCIDSVEDIIESQDFAYAEKMLESLQKKNKNVSIFFLLRGMMKKCSDPKTDEIITKLARKYMPLNPRICVLSLYLTELKMHTRSKNTALRLECIRRIKLARQEGFFDKFLSD